MVVLAQQNKQLVVLLLDFEKTYVKVYWDFLEAVLSRLGFPVAWIKVVFALYRHASSSILFTRGYGPLFPISMSVRQGCPLAPFLSILFEEVLSSYLRLSSAGTNGISLPFTQPIVLDAEFANDTTLYVDEEIGNLSRVQDALQVFLDVTDHHLIGISQSNIGWVKKLTLHGIRVLSDGFTMVNQFDIWDVWLV